MATSGKLRIFDGSNVLLLEFDLLNPSFSVTGDTATLLGVPIIALGLAGGQASVARIYDVNDNIIVDGLSAGISQTNFILETAGIAVNQINTLIGGVLVHG